uniref:Pimplin protein pim1 subunit n=1 Tax=Pimpla hypochondriaca TaxID=135724 RepID=Q8WPC8_PIMHY|nr:pimplin protein pim1 subunit [Pimpla hypochondriaca]
MRLFILLTALLAILVVMDGVAAREKEVPEMEAADDAVSARVEREAKRKPPRPNPKPKPIPSPNPKPKPDPSPNPKPKPNPSPNPKPQPKPRPPPSDHPKVKAFLKGAKNVVRDLAQEVATTVIVEEITKLLAANGQPVSCSAE